MVTFFFFLVFCFGYLLSLSLVCAGYYPHGPECFSWEMEAMGRTSNQWLLAGLLTVARICRKLAQATPCCRTLGSGNEAYADLHGSQILCQWKQQGV